MKASARIALTCTMLALVAGGVFWFLWRDAHRDPLRGLVEPITIVNAMSWDDGGSRGLEYRDARGVAGYVCLMDDLEGNQNLVLGSFLPVHDRSRLARWPVGGPEERSFLRVFERWARSNPDAAFWDQRYDQYERGKLEGEEFLEGASGEQTVQAMAVGVLRELRRRNPSVGRDEPGEGESL